MNSLIAQLYKCNHIMQNDKTKMTQLINQGALVICKDLPGDVLDVTYGTDTHCVSVSFNLNGEGNQACIILVEPFNSGDLPPGILRR